MGYRYLKILVRRVGAAGIPIYPGVRRLCLSACPRYGGVETKLPPTPEDNF